MPLVTAWFEEAMHEHRQPNPNAMALATIGGDGRPAVRIVLAKQFVGDPGYVVFFTNYRSRKGHELDRARVAAASIHWDEAHRQLRLTGPVTRSPIAESDAYFASRPLASRIGAWASAQSEPLASRAALGRQVQVTRDRFAIATDDESKHVPRPPHWGGFRLWIDTLELWVEGPGRVHDRAIWTRDLAAMPDDGFLGGAWTSTRLNP
jgi:pyridoxamine 5'-phosphate oxidase